MADSTTVLTFTIIGGFGVLLQFAVLYTMSRTALPRYWGVFVFLLVLFLTSVCDMAAYLYPGGYPDWYLYYWRVNNFLRHLSAFVAVLSMIFIATAAHPSRKRLLVASLFCATTAVGISLLVPEATASATATRVGRDLSFATIVLNVILWSSLIKTRHRDLRLFMASGGLGVNMAGEAIAQSMSMIADVAVFTNALAVGAHIFCLAVWFKAFRKPVAVDDQVPAAAQQLESTPPADGQFAPQDAES